MSEHLTHPQAAFLQHWTTTDEPTMAWWLDHGERSRVLVELVADVPKDARILEVGCGPGRNLAYLRDAGYDNLEAVEINENAVKLMRVHYPQLADMPVHFGPAEEVLATLDGPYDLVFTLATLVNIHPDSTVVFDEIARLADSVLVIESETLGGMHIAHHDYVTMFEARGMILRSRTSMHTIPSLAADTLGLDGYEAYWFDRR